MFLQYWGSGAGIDESRFSIRIYNATNNAGVVEPDVPIDSLSDEVLFNLTGKAVNQPARWYQSNYTNLILNRSKTYKNTFFVVFRSIRFPSLAGFRNDAYIYYALEQPDDKYDIDFYYRNGIAGIWENLSGKNGIFKAIFAPISPKPSSLQVNLTVFDTLVGSNGVYYNNSFFPNRDDQFFIPIKSTWFGDVWYNVTFSGSFQYDAKAVSEFFAKDGEDVSWKISLNINQYFQEMQERKGRFYKPSFWKYNSTYNETSLYGDVLIQVVNLL
ncbi:MAG: hypothetical protein ACTSRH_16735 [Promethearchaeota archaeon]